MRQKFDNINAVKEIIMNKDNKNFANMLTSQDKIDIAKDVMGDAVENYIIKNDKVPSNELHFVKSNDILNLEKVVFYDFKAFAIMYDDKEQSQAYRQLLENQLSKQFTTKLHDTLTKTAGKEYLSRLYTYSVMEDFYVSNSKKFEDPTDINTYVDFSKEGK